MYVNLNRIDVDFWMSFLRIFFSTHWSYSYPWIHDWLIWLIWLPRSLSLRLNIYLTQAPHHHIYCLNCDRPHQSHALNISSPYLLIYFSFWLKYPLINCINANFLTNHERLNSKPTQGQLRQLSSISNFFDKFRLV